MNRSTLKPHQTAILTAAVATIALWMIPGVQWVLLPLNLLNTHIHEACHALVSQSTGGYVHHILVHADGSGVTPVSGGSLFLTAMAGYVGASLVGLGIMIGSRNEGGARLTMRILAGVLALCMLLWLRGDGVGLVSGVFWIGALFAIARYATGPTLLFLAQFVGIAQCANAFQSLYMLLQISAVTTAHSDARLMEGVTGIPALAWAGIWCLFSGLLATLGLRKAWSRPLPSRPSRP
jgi:hypothetical protein